MLFRSEIAKVVYKNPEMLVVDETTTALPQKGREIIYGLMRKMRDENKAVIFISHDLQELMDVCDTLTVLRDGNLVATLDKEQMVEEKIKHMMVGREMKGSYYRSDYGTSVSDEIVLDVDDVTSGSGLLMNFSMKVHKGEILGIGGLSHCGMHELGKVIFGEEPALMGKVTYVPNGVTIDSAKVAFKNKRYDDAEKHLKKELVITPVQSPDQYFFLGKIAFELKKYSQAREYTMTGLDICGHTNADAYFLIAQAWFMENNLDSAAVQLQKVTELDPGNPQAINNLVLVYMQLGKKGDAQALIQKMRNKGQEIPQGLIDMVEQK